MSWQRHGKLITLSATSQQPLKVNFCYSFPSHTLKSWNTVLASKTDGKLSRRVPFTQRLQFLPSPEPAMLGALGKETMRVPVPLRFLTFGQDEMDTNTCHSSHLLKQSVKSSPSPPTHGAEPPALLRLLLHVQRLFFHWEPTKLFDTQTRTVFLPTPDSSEGGSPVLLSSGPARLRSHRQPEELPSAQGQRGCRQPWRAAPATAEAKGSYRRSEYSLLL